MTRPLVVITGASAGIGAEFARQLSAKNYNLLLVARRADRLRQLAATLPTDSECLALDLADPPSRTALCERLRNDANLAILVNNAGFGTRGRYWEADLATQRQMHELHVMATMELTHAALANLVANRTSPHPISGVINVASVAAFTRSPGNVSYCATKAWMAAFTESLELELKGIHSPVRIQALCPGFTYTEFHDVLQVDRAAIAKWLWMSAAGVVNDSIRGFEQRKLIVVPGWFYKLFVAVLPRLPHALQMALQSRSPHARARV